MDEFTITREDMLKFYDERYYAIRDNLPDKISDMMQWIYGLYFGVKTDNVNLEYAWNFGYLHHMIWEEHYTPVEHYGFQEPPKYYKNPIAKAYAMGAFSADSIYQTFTNMYYRMCHLTKIRPKQNFSKVVPNWDFDVFCAPDSIDSAIEDQYKEKYPDLVGKCIRSLSYETLSGEEVKNFLMEQLGDLYRAMDVLYKKCGLNEDDLEDKIRIINLKYHVK